MNQELKETRLWIVPGMYRDVVIGIRVGQTGYYEVDQSLTPDDMPEDVQRSFVEGSMFGWHTKAAWPAINWLEETR